MSAAYRRIPIAACILIIVFDPVFSRLGVLETIDVVVGYTGLGDIVFAIIFLVN